MYVKVVFFLHPDREQLPEIQELWMRLGRGPVEYQPFGYCLKLRAESAELRIVEEAAQRHGIQHSSRSEIIYSEEDLSHFDFYCLGITAYAGQGGNAYGTAYDTSHACPVCQTGWIQTSPLVINKAEMGKKDLAITYEYDYVISRRVADALQNENCSGYSLSHVKHYSQRSGKYSDLEVFQLFATNVLPPVVEPTVLLRSKEYCTVCGRHGLFFRSEPYYCRKSLTSLCDFNFTAEYVGEGRYPRQKLIISSKVYKLLKALKVRNFKVTPVHFVEAAE
jgi:hypothetical protein